MTLRKDLKVEKHIEIKADPESIWNALTDSEMIQEYFFGTQVVSNWKEGSDMVFQGEWEGVAYRDKGKIMVSIPGEVLKYAYWSKFSGLDDQPENYSTVTYKLKDQGNITLLSLTQEGFASDEGRQHAEEGWQMVLEGLKKLVEAD
jgi:uncharacterized protein YndB with AHSA1/START domain